MAGSVWPAQLHGTDVRFTTEDVEKETLKDRAHGLLWCVGRCWWVCGMCVHGAADRTEGNLGVVQS